VGARMSVHDAKLREFTRVAAPAHVDVIHASRGRPPLGPSEELLDRVLFSFGHELDAPVVAISDPTADAETTSFSLGSGPKEDPLHSSSDEELDALVGHVFDRYRIHGAPATERHSLPKVD
jgi:hypothetical protein